MKTWNAPDINELNINATENGWLDSCFEFWFLTNDDKKATPTTPTQDPVDNPS